MDEARFKRLIGEALGEFVASPEGQAALVPVVAQAMAQALTREIRFEDARAEPGRVVEKSQTWNLLDWLAVYLPRVEGAMRGAQADAASARNRATEARNGVALMVDMVERFRAGRALDSRPEDVPRIVATGGDA